MRSCPYFPTWLLCPLWLTSFSELAGTFSGRDILEMEISEVVENYFRERVVGLLEFGKRLPSLEQTCTAIVKRVAFGRL